MKVVLIEKVKVLLTEPVPSPLAAGLSHHPRHRCGRQLQIVRVVPEEVRAA